MTDPQTVALTRQTDRMRIAPIVVGLLVLFGLAVGGVMIGQGGGDAPNVELVFADSNGLPEELLENTAYRATFTIDWRGPRAERDGQVKVFASRRGDTSDDAPAGGWPLVCEEEYDNVVLRTRLACPFITPGPGEFALLLEVIDPNGDKLGEGLYTHLVVAPPTTTAAP